MTPKERKYELVDGHREALRILGSRAFLTRFAVAAIPVVCVAVYRLALGRSLSVAVLGSLIALGAAAIAIQSWLRGRVDSNLGSFLSDSEPVRFSASMLLLLVGYLAALFATIYADA